MRKVICGSVFFNVIENNVRDVKDKLYNCLDFEKEFLDSSITFEIVDCVGENFVTHCMIIYGYSVLDLSCIQIKNKLKDLISNKFEYSEVISINIDCFISET